MMSFFKSHSIYKLILIVFSVCIAMNLKSQLVKLNYYNKEISTLNEKIAILNEENDTENNSTDLKKEIEEIARKNLKMYYPNETPYKGY